MIGPREILASAAFEALVDDWVDAAYSNGTDGFSSLLLKLPGVYPADVLASLRRLAAHGFSPKLRTWAKRNAASALTDSPGLTIAEARWLTPVPHPLDYDWRFSPESAANLAERVAKICGSSADSAVVLLGVPSLRRALSEVAPNCKARLLDKQPFAGASPGFDWTGDLTADQLPLVDDRVAAVVADPPWYPEYFRSFLWAAAAFSVKTTRIFLGIPDVGTRPGVKEEWRELCAWAGSAGLELVQVLHRATEYITSPFERNALRAAGINNVPTRWRRGSVAEFRRSGPCLAPRPLTPEDVVWWELKTGLVRWRVRKGAAGPTDRLDSPVASPELLPIVRGDVLGSVSRRHPLHRSADVWTSGNRIYRCENPNMLRYILEALQSAEHGDTEPAQLVQHAFGKSLPAEARAQAERTARAILEILRIEHDEYGCAEGAQRYTGAARDQGRSVESGRRRFVD